MFVSILAPLKKKDKERGFNEELGVEYFIFLRDGIKNEIWCDNAKSFEIKNSLISEKGLRGFSVWALGQEDNNIWDYLKTK